MTSQPCPCPWVGSEQNHDLHTLLTFSRYRTTLIWYIENHVDFIPILWYTRFKFETKDLPYLRRSNNRYYEAFLYNDHVRIDTNLTTT